MPSKERMNKIAVGSNTFRFQPSINNRVHRDQTKIQNQPNMRMREEKQQQQAKNTFGSKNSNTTIQIFTKHQRVHLHNHFISISIALQSKTPKREKKSLSTSVIDNTINHGSDCVEPAGDRPGCVGRSLPGQVSDGPEPHGRAGSVSQVPQMQRNGSS